MESKTELIQIAADLKRIADRLLECCKEKEDCEDEEGEDKETVSKNPKVMALTLRRVMGKD
jgi:hypothetical protein